MSRLFVLSALATSSCLLSSASFVSGCKGRETITGRIWPFDTLDFPYRFTPPVPVVPQTPPMYLIGVGVIKQPGYIQDSVVAKVAVGCSTYTIDRAKYWKEKRFQDQSTLTEVLLRRENTITPYGIANPLKVSVIVHVTKDFGTKDFIKLFEPCFVSCSKEGLQTFRDTMNDVIGDRKLRAGDDVSIYFYDNGDLIFTKNEAIKAVIHFPEINQHILNGFIHPQHSAVDQLSDCIEENIQFIETA